MAFERPDSTLRDSLSAYAALVRVPNLFTAPPDVLAGAALALTTVPAATARPGPVAGLAVASILLYAAGTTLNDYFDAPEDAEERPERPIPSGAVSRESALLLGVGLLVGGVALAALAAGERAGLVAAALAAAIVLYDGMLKDIAAGFLAMGTTRGLNVTLGLAGVGVALGSLPAWVLAVPVVVTAYVAGVTYMASRETEGGNRGAVAIAAAGMLFAGVTATTVPRLAGADQSRAMVTFVLAAGFLLWSGRPLGRALSEPVPETVGPAVGKCVLGLVLLDAAFATVAGLVWAIVTAAFFPTALVLARTFDVT
jgi:4-hydroxybenzoate polyprenyltransferase